MNVANDKLSIDNYMLEYIFQSSITRTHVELFRTTFRWNYAPQMGPPRAFGRESRFGAFSRLHDTCNSRVRTALNEADCRHLRHFPSRWSRKWSGGRVYFLVPARTRFDDEEIEIIEVAIVMHSARVKRDCALFSSEIHPFSLASCAERNFTPRLIFRENAEREKTHLGAILLSRQRKRAVLRRMIIKARIIRAWKHSIANMRLFGRRNYFMSTKEKNATANILIREDGNGSRDFFFFLRTVRECTLQSALYEDFSLSWYDVIRTFLYYWI